MRAVYLLIGFLLMFSFPIGEITVLPLGGFLLILYSVLRMEKMEPVFKRSKYLLFGAIPVSLVLLVLQIYASVKGEGVAKWYETVYLIFRLLTELAEIGTMFFIYIGIKIIGTKAEVRSLENQSARNMWLMFSYFITQTTFTLLAFFAPQVFVGYEFIKVIPFVLGYLWRAFNILTAFTLHTKISVTKD